MRRFVPPISAEPSALTVAALQAVEPLLEVGRIGLWHVDLATGAYWWSDVTRRIHEVPSGNEPTLEAAIKLYSKGTQRDFVNIVEDAIANGNRWDVTYPLKTPNGKKAIIRARGLVILENGSARYILGTCEDVTESKNRSAEIERLALVVQQMTNAVIVCDRQGMATWANPAFETLSGYSVSSLIGQKPGALLQGSGTCAATRQSIAEALSEGRPFSGELLNYRPNGECYWIELIITPIVDTKGLANGFIGVANDVTARREAQMAAAAELQARQAAETLLRDIIDSVPAMITAYDNEERLILTNGTQLDVFPGYLASMQPGTPMAEVIEGWLRLERNGKPMPHDKLMNSIKKLTEAGKLQVQNHERQIADGRWLMSSARRSPSGNLIWVSTDISALKTAERAAHKRANSDELTGLLNRAGFMDHVKSTWSSNSDGSKNWLESGCLVIFDIDHFKSVNDSYGHAAGDALLSAVGKRLKAATGKNGMAARLGGDEFAFYVPAADDACVRTRVDKIMAACARSVQLGPTCIVPSFSVGIAHLGPQRQDYHAIVRQADRALYEAKRRGRGRVIVYSDQLDEAVTSRRRLAERLRTALVAGEVDIALQPKLRLSDGVITGFEALARWHDGTRWVPPPQFVAAAEEHALAERLGSAVLEKALIACKQLQTVSEHPIQVSVNISTAQLLAENFAQSVIDFLDNVGLPASALELEITETVLFDRSFSFIVGTLSALRARGIRLALDDFGTGHASLSHLGAIAIDSLKIDRSFVAAIGDDRRRELIVRTIAGLARGLELECVAEGVETRQQQRFVKAKGCSHVQGYLVSRPLSTKDAMAFLRTHQQTGCKAAADSLTSAVCSSGSRA